MHTGVLKAAFLFIFSFHLSLCAQAQQTRFIYVQTENGQPFYIKMDKRVFSSSALGYLIISGLIDSAYKLAIGFPKNEWAELNVTVNVKDTNAGFLLKNYGEGGWGMINMQSKEFLVMQQSTSLNRENEVKISDDEFARVLAAVVNDPSIAEVTVAKKSTVTAIETMENKTVVIPSVNEALKPDTAGLSSYAAVTAKPNIAKLMQDSTSEGLLITYLDSVSTGTDTVKVFLPSAKIIPVNEKATVLPNTVSEKGSADSTDTRFINMELQNPNAKADSGSVKKDDFVITEKKETKAAGLSFDKGMLKAGCKKTATQNDFLKLRKQMAADDSEKNMIKTANKVFINTCFTTGQIKNLGVLFITEEEKYKFYVAAFPYVTDKDNFGALEDQLTDNYYKTRFNAMLSH